VFEFNDKNVGQVMTPRERIFAVSYDLPTQRLVKELAARGFSRVPIYQKTLDNVRGIVHAKDLVRTVGGRPLHKPLVELLHEPLFVPRTTPVKRLFLTFKQKKVHMAIVVSEYGKVLGLVTMDDLLSQIFGVLRDERADLQMSIPPGRYRVRTPPAGAPVARPSSTPGEGTPKLIDPDATGPVNVEDDSGPHRRPSRPDTGDSGPIHGANSLAPETAASGDTLPRAGSDPGLPPRDSVPVVEPPPEPPPGLRSVHHVDEVTPPPADVHDLINGGKGR
jgi:CBS domain-containing protein